MAHNHEANNDHNHDRQVAHSSVQGSLSGSASEKALLEQAQAKLRTLFAGMPHEVPLLLFTSLDKEEVFAKAAREVLGAMSKFTTKISVNEQDLYGKLAKKWDVQHSPTLLFDPDHYPIESGRNLLETRARNDITKNHVMKLQVSQTICIHFPYIVLE